LVFINFKASLISNRRKSLQIIGHALGELGVGGNVGAMEALAELITYLDPSKGFRKTRNLLGLFKPIRGRRKIYSGHLRRALQRLTASTNNTTTHHLTAKKEKETLSRVWRICRQEALGRLATPAQG
jgi:hypothetical protein